MRKDSANLIRALYNLSREPDTARRKTLLNAGLVEMIKWFSLAARKIIERKMILPKQTQKFMDRHKEDVRQLASAMVDPETKRAIILKPGGGGFLGGVIIRSLIRWDGNKLLRRFNKAKQPKQKKKPKKKKKAPPKRQKKKSPKKKPSKKKSSKRRRIKLDDRHVTVRIKKPRKPPSPVAGPSTARTPSPFATSTPNSSLRTPSPFSTRFSTPSSSLRKIGENLTPAKTPTPEIARFSPLNSDEPFYLRTARQHGFEAAMKQLQGMAKRRLDL